jgi:hypothetical protein
MSLSRYISAVAPRKGDWCSVYAVPTNTFSGTGVRALMTGAVPRNPEDLAALGRTMARMILAIERDRNIDRAKPTNARERRAFRRDYVLTLF